MTYESGVLEDSYDVIIIGAGIGGLTCGCYLAKAGMKVLIVEQHNKPGGCCTSFVRNGVIFDAAVHTLSTCKEGDLLGQILDELNLRDEIKLVRTDPTDIILTKDYEVPIKLDLEETIDILCNIFPNEVLSIKNFFRYINSVDRGKIHKYLELSSKRFGDLLQGYFNDKDLISILSVLLLNTGVPSCESSTLVAILAYKGMLDGGYYPVGAMQGFSDTFARRFIEYGGTLLLSNKIKKIEIEDREVRGIRFIDNEYIQAKYVVSNCDASQTYFELIGKNSLPLEFINKINGLLTTTSYFTVYLGLNRSLPRNDKRNGTIWYSPTMRIDELFSEVFYDKYPYFREGLICNLIPKVNAQISGDVCEVVYISVGASYKDLSYWKENREMVADELIKRAEDIFSGISSSIVVRSIGTPHDIERFTLNYRGATNGWACTPKQVSFPVIKRNTSIKGLYMIGHWVSQSFGGGVAAVANIGRNTAALIERNNRRGDIT